VGVLLETLKQVTVPGTLVRALPISCAAINKSPTLIYPDNPRANLFFSLLGQVHPLSNESYFTPASVISAFYGWIFALAQEVIDWTIQTGVPPLVAKSLILETMEGMAAISLAQNRNDLHGILRTLATPGGITELGLKVLNKKGAITNWNEALKAVFNKLTYE
ncbi:MAG: pyrroline-5-carboxylate reductase dimerization domain-containing protein, partial [Candidatus Hodarchaeales archaeon]